MPQRLLSIIVLLTLAIACYAQEREGKLQYVNPLIGTAANSTMSAGRFGKHSEELGQTIPAVTTPHGMTSWTPQTQDTEHKCIAPYYYADGYLQGFRASHWLIGGCTQDYGSFTIMPLSGTLRCSPEDRATPFRHNAEVSTPAYYAVELPEEALTAELTATTRAAIIRLTYSTAGKGYLIVTPNSDYGEGTVTIDSLHQTIYASNPVHRIYQGWGETAGFSGHLVLQYNKAITSCGVFTPDSIIPHCTEIGHHEGIGAYIEFDVAAGEEVLVRAATSFVDIAGAENNLMSELPQWNFDNTLTALRRTWEQQLSLIDVTSDNTDDLVTFYSALYRASCLPRTMNDIDGRYPAFATGEITSVTDGTTYYDDFSLWDTYRALHPLLTLISPTTSGEMMQSLVEKYRSGGWLPIFPCWNSYTAAMIGDHATAAISDAYVKGVTNFDIYTAYDAMRQNAFTSPTDDDYADGKGRRALQSYLHYGYIPLEDSVLEAFHTNEQVSRTMEYAYDDFALAQVARRLHNDDDYRALIARAKNYRNVISPITGYAQGRYASGAFLTDDNAYQFTSFITEGIPAHYTWYVPHDPYGLIDIIGGRDKYVAKLDSLFADNYYWHGNEPSHNIAFMYNYAGEPWKTQRLVRQILHTEYSASPGGLAGNDDAGQMAAWYVFAAMGFYPVCPATPFYLLAAPAFPTVTLQSRHGRPFTIIADDLSESNIYIQRATLNGRAFTRNYLVHDEILRGGTLILYMGSEPNPAWGSNLADCPPDVME